MDSSYKILLSEIDYAFANLDDSNLKQYIVSSVKLFSIVNWINTDEDKQEIPTQEVYDYDEEWNLLWSHTEAIREDNEPFIQD